MTFRRKASFEQPLGELPAAPQLRTAPTAGHPPFPHSPCLLRPNSGRNQPMGGLKLFLPTPTTSPLTLLSLSLLVFIIINIILLLPFSFFFETSSHLLSNLASNSKMQGILLPLPVGYLTPQVFPTSSGLYNVFFLYYVSNGCDLLCVHSCSAPLYEFF